MRLAHALLVSHALVLVFCVMGIAIALPNPQLWANDPIGRQVFAFGMERGGMVQIMLAAAAMAVAGGFGIGWRYTLLFAAATCAVAPGRHRQGTTVHGHIEVAGTIAWLVSDAASGVTGATLTIDGGAHVVDAEGIAFLPPT